MSDLPAVPDGWRYAESWDFEYQHQIMYLSNGVRYHMDFVGKHTEITDFHRRAFLEVALSEIERLTNETANRH